MSLDAYLIETGTWTDRSQRTTMGMSYRMMAHVRRSRSLVSRHRTEVESIKSLVTEERWSSFAHHWLLLALPRSKNDFWCRVEMQRSQGGNPFTLNNWLRFPMLYPNWRAVLPRQTSQSQTIWLTFKEIWRDGLFSNNRLWFVAKINDAVKRLIDDAWTW
jgi:hypothetical protein